jgi:hypothetical protein
MKAISIREPWATLIAEGKKTIEVRSWPTKYRGELLICASQKPKGQNSGMAVAIVNLVDVRLMKKGDEKKALCELFTDCYSWILKDVKKIEPFPVKGKLGFYDIDVP